MITRHVGKPMDHYELQPKTVFALLKNFIWAQTYPTYPKTYPINPKTYNVFRFKPVTVAEVFKLL